MSSVPHQLQSGASEDCVTDRDVDSWSLRLFHSLTATVGRPFRATERSMRSVVPDWITKFHDHSPDTDPIPFMTTYMTSSFFKRFMTVSELAKTDLLEANAFSSFAATCDIGERWVLPPEESESGYIIELAAMRIGSVLGQFRWLDVFPLCGHGPNASVGLSRLDSFVHKKCHHFTGTPSAHSVFEQYLSWDTSYPTGDEVGGNRLSYYKLHFAAVNSSVLSFVPKRWDKLRSITVVPIVNMFLGLGLGRRIAQRLFRVGIDLSSQQDVHKNLARLASEYPEMHLATVDWTEASDRLWVLLIERLLRYAPGWFPAIQAIRCGTTQHVSTHTSLNLPMIGGMGEGFTFPLQTLVFWALISACADLELWQCERRRRDLPVNFWGGVTTFGDDCICDSRLLPRLNRLAQVLCWRVNVEKTFSEGPIRESCGGDYYYGMAIRPFFLERPEGLTRNRIKAWAYNAYNGIYAAFGHIYTNMPEIDSWLEDIHTSLGLGKICCVPPHMPPYSGVLTVDPSSIRFASAHVPRRVVVPRVRCSYDKSGESYLPPTTAWKYRFIRAIPVDYENVVEEDAYYWLRLSSKPLPASFDWRKPVYNEIHDGGSAMLIVKQAKAYVPSKAGVSYVPAQALAPSWRFAFEH